MSTEDIKPDISGWKRIYDHYVKEKVEGAPKISVIIPSYNTAHLLETSLQSFVSQRNVDKELIIIDAGSEDHTPSILEKYKGNIDKIYYVARNHMPMMINKGFSLATGGYVCFLYPGVEYLNQSTLSHISEVAYENQKPEVVFSASYLTLQVYREIKDALHKAPDEIAPIFHYFPFSKSWLKRGFIPSSPCSFWFRTDYIWSIKGFKCRNKSIKRAFLDLLCHIRKDKKISVASTYWSTTMFDTRLHGEKVSALDFFNTFNVLRKHFGIFNSILWLFKDKPVRFSVLMISKLRSLFKET